MPVIIDEHTQYMNEGGKPLVNGKVFIGVVNQDPKLNPQPIFADPALTTPLANPQALDSFGRTVNKTYVAGRYSFKLEDSGGGQIVQDLDRGSVPAVGITVLTNVQGTNTITAEANPIISVYVDKAQFSLTIINSPTGATTLNIDGLGAVPIKNKGNDILPGQLLANGLIVVAFNIIGPVFELVSGLPLSSPGPIGDVTPNSIKGTTIKADTSFEAVSGTTINEFSTDSTLAGNSDDAVPTEKAVKTAIDTASGRVLQILFFPSTVILTTTSDIPNDNTIPQNTEGVQVMTLAITPKNTTSKLIVEVSVFGGDTNVAWTIALFKDSIVNALTVANMQIQVAGVGGTLGMAYSETSGSLATRIFKVRFGGPGGRFNQNKNLNTFGGIPKSFIKITEVLP